jgi:hypothetical protein
VQLLEANVAFVKVLALEWNQLASVLLNSHFGLLSKWRVRFRDDNWALVKQVTVLQRVEEFIGIAICRS